MSLKVYHLRLSQSERVTWLLEELQLPYELHIFDRDPVSALAPAELKALHPAGTAPFFEDTTVDPPVRLGESGAIVSEPLSIDRASLESLSLQDVDRATFRFNIFSPLVPKNLPSALNRNQAHRPSLNI